MPIKLTLEFETLEDLRVYLDDKTVVAGAQLGMPATVTAGALPDSTEYLATPVVADDGGTFNHDPVTTTVQQFAAETTAGVNEGVEIDTDGIPWDARIHTKNKAKTQKGVWKRKPGVADADFGEVVGELQAAMADAPAPVAAPVTSVPQVSATPTLTQAPADNPAALFGAPTAAPSVTEEPARTWADICDAAHTAQLRQACDLHVFSQLCTKYGYNETTHGKGQQNVALWCEHQTDQATKNAIHADLMAL